MRPGASSLGVLHDPDTPHVHTAGGGNIPAGSKGVEVPHRIMCQFAATHIQTMLGKFLAEIDGVRRGDDIEPLHRMRVASRRLRVGFRTFRHCVPDKKYQKLYSETRDITRALSQARDADVQIAFLKKAKKQASARNNHKKDAKDNAAKSLLEAIQYLLARLRKERALYQKNVLASLDKIEKRNVSESIRRAGFMLPPQTRNRMHGSPSTLTYLAAENIGRCYVDLLASEPWVQYPDATAEHHAMRIAAKNLRYTMEVFTPVYRLGLRKYIAKIARLQRILGDLHDTDVWIDMVTLTLLKERSRPRALGDTSRPSPEVIAGLKVFLQDRERDRMRIYKRMVRYWDFLKHSHFWDDFRKEMLANHRIRYTRETSLSRKEKSESVIRSMQGNPGGEAHSRHVATLSLQLFDQLQVYHNLSERERCWLEYGALLHDIGLKGGKKGHAKRGALMIHNDEQMPFSLQERGVIAALAESHRGSASFERSGYYRILPEQEQLVIRVLTGILRVADGLDGTHRGKVESLTCEVSPDEVSMLVSALSDCSQEISMAKSKADLFEHTFMKTLKIRQESPMSISPGAMHGPVPEDPDSSRVPLMRGSTGSRQG